MRVSLSYALIALPVCATAKCATNECLRAIQKVAKNIREEDCASFMQATVTPATSTITQTTTVTSPSRTGLSERWLQRHEVIDILMNRGEESSFILVKPTATPSYAAQCSSSAGYASACSCLGFHPVTVTAPIPLTTETVSVKITTTAIHANVSHGLLGNSSGLWRNSTGLNLANGTAVQFNSTTPSTATFRSDSSAVSKSPAPLTESTASDKYRLKKPTPTGDTLELNPSTTFASAPSFGTPIGFGGIGGFSNLTTAHNSTTSTAKALNATNSLTAASTGSSTPSSNFTRGAINTSPTSAPFLNSTRNGLNSTTKIPSWNATSFRPLTNATTSPLLNATHTAKFLNTTTSAPFMNITHPVFVNSTSLPRNITRAPFLNSTTSVRFSNTSSMPTPTPTLDRTCGVTASPFAVHVAQPGGMFDGWYLKLSGDAVIFVPAKDMSTRFSVEKSGHLCAVGVLGTKGNAVIAIAENATDVGATAATSGSEMAGGSSVSNGTVLASESEGGAVYFIDPEVLLDIDQLGYDSLSCTVDGSGKLACKQGNKSFWTGCGLGLDITSDGDGAAVVDGWNCTGVALSAIYS